MLTIEKRPTDPLRIAKMLMIGVPLAVVIAGFSAPLWVAYDLSVLSPGDTAGIRGHVQDGPAGAVKVESIDGDMAVVSDVNGDKFNVPVENLVER